MKADNVTVGPTVYSQAWLTAQQTQRIALKRYSTQHYLHRTFSGVTFMHITTCITKWGIPKITLHPGTRHQHDIYTADNCYDISASKSYHQTAF